MPPVRPNSRWSTVANTPPPESRRVSPRSASTRWLAGTPLMRKVIEATVSRRSVARRLASTAVTLSPPERALQPSWRRSAPGSGAVVEVAGAGAASVGASGRARPRPATKARPATTRVAAARAIRSRGGAAGGAGAGSAGGRPGCWGSWAVSSRVARVVWQTGQTVSPGRTASQRGHQARISGPPR